MTEQRTEDELKRDIILGGIDRGRPEVGYMTNPETAKHPGYIEFYGEKIVCDAKGGECRFNDKYRNNWTTPIIQLDCPNECPFKMLVCDNHPNKGKDCKDAITPYSQHNKFSGQFSRFCRTFSKLK